MLPRPIPRVILAVVALLVVAARGPLAAPKFVVSKHEAPPPTELAEPICALLATGGQTVTIGGTVIEFWWVKAVPLGAAAGGSGSPGWSEVEEGRLVGAVRLSAPHDELRGRKLNPGVYTLRYGIQPANGDHLGVSAFRDFLLLSPASVDKNPAPTGHEGTVDLSKQSIGISHPAVWSVEPPTVAKYPPMSIYPNEQGHRGVVFEVPAARGDKPAGALRFGLILIGTIEA